MDYTSQEALELEATFGVDAEHHDQNGRHFLITVENGEHCEAFELKRNPDTARLEVHDGDDFDWKVL